MMKDRFYLKDVVDLIGVKRCTLQQWIRDGYVAASIPGDGSGVKSIFTFDDVCRIKLFKILVDYGYTRRLASVVIQPKSKNDGSL